MSCGKELTLRNRISMNLSIQKSALLALLSKTQNIVERRSSMPALVNVLFVAENDQLQVFATDLEVSLISTTPAKIEVPGKMGVNSKSLFEIVKELRDEPIYLSKNENNWLQITQNRSLFHIVGISAEEYPIFPSFVTKEFFPVAPKILREMIDKTIYSVSSDESRYHLNGVYFERREPQSSDLYRMVATDGYRLSLVDRHIADQDFRDFANGVIIPRKGLIEIKKMLEDIETPLKMAIEGTQLIVIQGPTTLMVRLIEGRYPNYQQLIPQNVAHRLQINRQDLLDSVKRVSLLSNQKSKTIAFCLSNGRLQIKSNNPEMGDASEDMDINYQGSELRIGFNARYILDILSSFSDDLVDFELIDQLSPGLIRPHNDHGHTCVIMPMRLE